MVESLLMLSVLTTLLLAAVALGRYADIRLSAEHHLQQALFEQARRPVPALRDSGRLASTLPIEAPWRDIKGQAWLPDKTLQARYRATPTEARIDGNPLADRWAASLRESGMLRLDLEHRVVLASGLRWGPLTPFPDYALQRSVYRGTGHALDAAHATARLLSSEPLWGQLRSRHALSWGRAVASTRGIETAWSRPGPDRNWLQPIQDLVPEDRLQVFRP